VTRLVRRPNPTLENGISLTEGTDEGSAQKRKKKRLTVTGREQGKKKQWKFA